MEPAVLSTQDHAVARTDLPPSAQRAAENLRSFVANAQFSVQTYRRRDILEAFVRLASSIGYEAVTMRKLGDEVGVKAPSIYRHFPGGRDQIVTEAYRWHFYRFASEIIGAVDGTTTAAEYWHSIIRVHLHYQMRLPENDMWDILIASDRVAGFLPAEARAEYRQWLALYDAMHAAAAIDLGHTFSNVDVFVRLVVKILDTANEWCHWDGSDSDFDRCVNDAVRIATALASTEIGGPMQP